MVRVLIFGTHPNQFNGYAKIVYELIKRVHGVDGIEMGVFGFQAYSTRPGHREDIPKGVYLYDAWANEEPKHQGFGIEQVTKVVSEWKPDICIVYNDMMIVTTILDRLHAMPFRKFKIVAYIDQVYLNQKKHFIESVNKKADAAILFTEHWKKIIISQGLEIPSYVLEHGFDSSTYFPIPKNVARCYLGLSNDDFLILNLNRNQPRKRWDTCLKAFAEIVSRNPNEPIKLIIGTAVQGSWDLIEIYERELKKRGLTLEEGMKKVVLVDSPQQLSDFDINVLYNVADIGINTCDGEGFGLCNFEQAAIGVPQVVTRLGGFVDYFDDNSAMLVDPTIAFYVDGTRDAVGGEALMCSYNDVVIAIESYYNDRKLLRAHGQSCRESIPKKYGWPIIADKLVSIIKSVSAPLVVEEVKMETIKEEEVETKKKTKKGKKKMEGKDKAELLKIKARVEKLLLEQE
jgi:glycosyltransferase involved in cell wall biosynthesis